MPAESSCWRPPKCSTRRSTTVRGQPRHLGEQPVAARGDGAVEVLAGAEAERAGHRRPGRPGRWGRAPRARSSIVSGVVWRRLPAGQVVADDELALGVDAGDELLELEREQPAVGAELEDVVLDLAGDPGDHLEALRDDGDVADGDQVLDLQRREGRGDLVEAQLVALEGRQRLVGAGEDLAGVLEHVPGLADVRRDDLHRLRHRDHREAGLPGDPVGGAVPGAGLLGGDRVVGHQVHGRAVDAGDVLVDDDRAVHLGQLAQAGGGERHVEGEAAGRDRLDDLVVAEHDQRAGAAAQDALEPVAQRRCPGAIAARVARRRSVLVDALWPPTSSRRCAGRRPVARRAVSLGRRPTA